MDPIYENTDFTLSPVASDENCSRHEGNSTEEREREVTSPKWAKVLLIVLGFSLVFALGGLCALWGIYNHKLADFESLNEQHVTVSKTLVAQEINSTAMKKEFNDLTARYDTLRERLSFCDVMKKEFNDLTARYNTLRERLSFCDAMKKEFNDLTARYNTLRERLSFYDAQSCNISVNGRLACRGKLYLFSSDELNWSNSRDVCVSKGADLVTITSKSEQDFLVSKIKETHWIGLNDLDTEGHWVWVNNRTLSDTGVQFWFSGDPKQPNNRRQYNPSGENCAALGDVNSNLDSWYDASCKTPKKFICEREY